MAGPANYLQGEALERFVQRAQDLLRQGESATTVARRFEVSVSTLTSRLKRFKRGVEKTRDAQS